MQSKVLVLTQRWGARSALLVLSALAAEAPRAEVQFDYTGPPVNIPDNNPAGVNVLISVSGLNAITDMNVRLPAQFGCDATPGNVNAAISHTFVGDLILKLTSPAGTEVRLINRRGGTRENFCFTRLDDEGGFPALSTITSQTGSSVNGSYAPDAPLSAFDGENPNGQWQLNISDNAASNTGMLRRFAFVLDTLPDVINVDVLIDPNPGSCTPGSCSLREAVALANASPGPERIVLPASLSIALTRAGANDDANISGDLDISDDLEIVGAGPALTTLTQTAIDRVFHVIGTDTDFTLRNLRVQGGSGVDDGGALLMPSGALLVEDVMLNGHRALKHGGAISNSGSGTINGPPKLLFRRVTFEDNRATNAAASNAFGGALYSLSSGSQDDFLLIEDCIFNNNRADNGGGALALDGVQSVSNNGGTISASTFTQNQVTAAGPGGAIGTNVEGNGLFTLSIIGSVFQQNSTPISGVDSVGGAIAQRNGTTAVIANSIFTQNSARAGGASIGNVAEIVDSTFCFNTATDQGAALSLGSSFDTAVRRSTFCANSVTTSDTAQFGGGAIAKLFGSLTVERSTLDGNSALRGAAIAFGGDDLSLRSNTIVAPSPLPAGALGSVLRYTNTDVTDSLFFVNNILIGQCSYSAAGINPDSALNNIESSGNTCRLLVAAFQAGNQTVTAGTAINLGALAPNGGATNTRLMAAPSVAINTGSTLACTLLDQRGYLRTDGSCDIGAVELGAVLDLIFASRFE